MCHRNHHRTGLTAEKNVKERGGRGDDCDDPDVLLVVLW